MYVKGYRFGARVGQREGVGGLSTSFCVMSHNNGYATLFGLKLLKVAGYRLVDRGLRGDGLASQLGPEAWRCAGFEPRHRVP